MLDEFFTNVTINQNKHTADTVQEHLKESLQVVSEYLLSTRTSRRSFIEAFDYLKGDINMLTSMAHVLNPIVSGHFQFNFVPKLGTFSFDNCAATVNDNQCVTVTQSFSDQRDIDSSQIIDILLRNRHPSSTEFHITGMSADKSGTAMIRQAEPGENINLSGQTLWHGAGSYIPIQELQQSAIINAMQTALYAIEYASITTISYTIYANIVARTAASALVTATPIEITITCIHQFNQNLIRQGKSYSLSPDKLEQLVINVYASGVDPFSLEMFNISFTVSPASKSFINWQQAKNSNVPLSSLHTTIRNGMNGSNLLRAFYDHVSTTQPLILPVYDNLLKTLLNTNTDRRIILLLSTQLLGYAISKNRNSSDPTSQSVDTTSLSSDTTSQSSDTTSQSSPYTCYYEPPLPIQPNVEDLIQNNTSRQLQTYGVSVNPHSLAEFMTDLSIGQDISNKFNVTGMLNMCAAFHLKDKPKNFIVTSKFVCSVLTQVINTSVAINSSPVLESSSQLSEKYFKFAQTPESINSRFLGNINFLKKPYCIDAQIVVQALNDQTILNDPRETTVKSNQERIQLYLTYFKAYQAFALGLSETDKRLIQEFADRMAVVTQLYGNMYTAQSWRTFPSNIAGVENITKAFLSEHGLDHTYLITNQDYIKYLETVESNKQFRLEDYANQNGLWSIFTKTLSSVLSINLMLTNPIGYVFAKTVTDVVKTHPAKHDIIQKWLKANFNNDQAQIIEWVANTAILKIANYMFKFNLNQLEGHRPLLEKSPFAAFLRASDWRAQSTLIESLVNDNTRGNIQNLVSSLQNPSIFNAAVKVLQVESDQLDDFLIHSGTNPRGALEQLISNIQAIDVGTQNSLRLLVSSTFHPAGSSAVQAIQFNNPQILAITEGLAAIGVVASDLNNLLHPRQ